MCVAIIIADPVFDTISNSLVLCIIPNSIKIQLTHFSDNFPRIYPLHEYPHSPSVGFHHALPFRILHDHHQFRESICLFPPSLFLFLFLYSLPFFSSAIGSFRIAYLQGSWMEINLTLTHPPTYFSSISQNPLSFTQMHLLYSGLSLA